MNKKGLTLVEIIISVVIIVLIATSMISAFVGVRRFVLNSTYRVQGYLFAKEALDTLRCNFLYSDPQLSTEILSNPHSETEISSSGIIRGNMSSLSKMQTQLTYVSQDVPPLGDNGCKKVIVTVKWKEAGID